MIKEKRVLKVRTLFCCLINIFELKSGYFRTISSQPPRTLVRGLMAILLNLAKNQKQKINNSQQFAKNRELRSIVNQHNLVLAQLLEY